MLFVKFSCVAAYSWEKCQPLKGSTTPGQTHLNLSENIRNVFNFILPHTWTDFLNNWQLVASVTQPTCFSIRRCLLQVLSILPGNFYLIDKMRLPWLRGKEISDEFLIIVFGVSRHHSAPDTKLQSYYNALRKFIETEQSVIWPIIPKVIVALELSNASFSTPKKRDS